MPSFERPSTHLTGSNPSLLLDVSDCVSPGQMKHACMELQQDVCKSVIEVVYFCPLLGLFIDKIAVPMHLSS